jgi:hypothetical protein
MQATLRAAAGGLAILAALATGTASGAGSAPIPNGTDGGGAGAPVLSGAAPAPDALLLLADSPAGFSFTGTWDCKGSFQPSTRPHHSKYEGRGAFGDRWIELVETDIDPPGYVAHYLIGRDEARHQLVELDANNAGYAIYTSPGWHGRTLVMTGTDTVSYANPKNRFVFEIQSPDVFTVAWQINKGGPDWVAADQLTCRKPAATAQP